MKKALITGVTGQDGSYLSEILLSKNYKVLGIKRRTSSFNTKRIDHLYKPPEDKNKKFELIHGDMTDSSSLFNIIQSFQPDEIYNLAAQSHVSVSFEEPEYTANSDALGTLRILEAIKSLNLIKKTKFYQASTSELFGKTKSPQNEKSLFHPRSPYGVAKLYAYWITKNYREAYNIFASNGILFNHESPRRGETFVTKKIVTGLIDYKLNKNKCLYLGNIYSRRDWGHAKDYMEAAWLILQNKTPDDFCIGTGKQITVKKFIELVCKKLSIKIQWVGKGINERAIDKENNKIFIRINKRYFRPAEVEDLRADISKAKKVLKWKPKININQLIDEMIDYDFKNKN